MSYNPVQSHDDDMSLFGAYLEWLRQCGRSQATIDDRRGTLTRAHNALEFGLNAATTDEIAAWLYRPEWSDGTKETYYGALVSYFRWATAGPDPYLDYDPTAGLPARPKAPKGIARPVTDEQLKRILTEARDPYRLWTLLAAYQGLRCIEIAGLDREHITEQTLIVVRGKGGKPRVGMTHPDVWAAVKDLPPGPLARRVDNGERADRRYVSLRTYVYFERRLGMHRVGLHMMRHWLGCTVQRRYRNSRVTQQILGHESLQSTQIYTQATSEEQRDAMATLPRFSG